MDYGKETRMNIWYVWQKYLMKVGQSESDFDNREIEILPRKKADGTPNGFAQYVPNITGKIVDVRVKKRFVNAKLRDFISVYIDSLGEEVIVSMEFDSNPGKNFAKAFRNIELNRSITIDPYWIKREGEKTPKGDQKYAFGITLYYNKDIKQRVEDYYKLEPEEIEVRSAMTKSWDRANDKLYKDFIEDVWFAFNHGAEVPDTMPPPDNYNQDHDDRNRNDRGRDDRSNDRGSNQDRSRDDRSRTDDRGRDDRDRGRDDRGRDNRDSERRPPADFEYDRTNPGSGRDSGVSRERVNLDERRDRPNDRDQDRDRDRDRGQAQPPNNEYQRTSRADGPRSESGRGDVGRDDRSRDRSQEQDPRGVDRGRSHEEEDLPF